MARVRKPDPTLEALFFSTPEQKVLRLLLSEPTTSFTARVISSRLKGVRGLGGAEGIQQILLDMESLGLVDFLDNQRAARVRDECAIVQIFKTVAAVCDLETLRKLLEPIASRGILFGSRAAGKSRTDSDYDLFIVSDQPDEVRHIGERHPLGRAVELVIWNTSDFESIDSKDPGLKEKLMRGVVLWGPTW